MNTLARTLARLEPIPAPLRNVLLGAVARRAIRYMGTTGIALGGVCPARVELRLKNRRRIQNHIGGIAAAAAVLLCEIAAGLIVSLNVQDGSVPVLKSMRFDFNRRIQGGLCAVATLSEEERAKIQRAAKGSTTVCVELQDDSGRSPIDCALEVAWTPKRR